jgi:L,D-transpeptidase catalytic domain
MIPRVKFGRMLGGVVALALVGAPTALAQTPAEPEEPAAQDAAVDPATERGPAGPEPAKLRLKLKSAHGGSVRVGDRFTVSGVVGPFVQGQEVVVLFKRYGKTVRRLRLPVKRAGKDGNIGTFEQVSPRLIKPGKYKAQVQKLATPEQDGAHRSTENVGVDFPDLDPGDHGKGVKLFNQLLAKKAYHTDRGKSYGSSTARAVLAYRKVNNMARTMNATKGMFKKLAAGKGGFKLKWPSGGKHVEADLSRQVMVLAKNGKPQHIFHVSSGAPATPTIRGKFPTYRKDYGTNSLGMVHSVYFIRGYATHGYHSVPTYPASHGCLRNPIPDSKFIFDWIDYGDVFYVYG